jgi:hypothetical protein
MTTLDQYLKELTEAAERVQELASKHGLECPCSRCVAAWGVLGAIEDNPPAELQAVLGGER